MNEKEFLFKLQNLDFEKLENEKGLGSILVKNIQKFVESERMKNLIIASEILEKSSKALSLSHNPAAADTGITCVLTGSFETPRSQIKIILEQHGIKVTSSVSKKTTYALVGSEPGSTAQKASKIGVQIYSSLSKFREILLQDHNITIDFTKAVSTPSKNTTPVKNNTETKPQEEIDSTPLF